MSDKLSVIPYTPAKERHKTVAVCVQLRVPRAMNVNSIEREVRDRLESDPRFIVYRNRVEVFAP